MIKLLSLFLALSLLIPLNKAYSQDMASFGGLFEKPATKKEQFKFISSPKGSSASNFKISCWNPDNQLNPELNNKSIKSFITNMTSYSITFDTGKKASVPIDRCFIMEI